MNNGLMRRLLLPFLALLLVGTATAARADDVSDAATALRRGPVYEAPGLDVVDVATLRSELAGREPRVLVAVLPASAADSDAAARQRAIEIGTRVGDPESVVLVITANQRVGTALGHAAAERGVDAQAALRAELASAGLQGFTKDGLTSFVTSFTERVVNQASSRAAGGSDGGSSSSSKSGGGGGRFFLLLLLVGAVVVGLVIRSGRQRRKRLEEGLRAEVEQLYERLGADVANLDPGDDKVAKQALADAAERFNACGAQLAEADAPAEYAAARRTAVEGLTAARTARTALGLDPGPEIPVMPGDGPQLADREQVAIGGQTYEGSPQYEPGRQHYFGGGMVGGQMIPGGWYAMPFWEPFLLGSILSGGFGGGGGFERGYEQGYDAGHDAGGGDWGGGGGGGGGDWGGGGDGGGGGDW